jgi:hypothetical protein
VRFISSGFDQNEREKEGKRRQKKGKQRRDQKEGEGKKHKLRRGFEPRISTLLVSRFTPKPPELYTLVSGIVVMFPFVVNADCE